MEDEDTNERAPDTLQSPKARQTARYAGRILVWGTKATALTTAVGAALYVSGVSVGVAVLQVAAVIAGVSALAFAWYVTSGIRAELRYRNNKSDE